MSFFGKQYVFDRNENFDGFLDSLGSEITAEAKQHLLNSKPTLKLVKDGDTYKLYTPRPNDPDYSVAFKSGQEFDEPLVGNPAKSTYNVEGNIVNQVQKFDNGTVFTIKREFSDSDAVVTTTSNKWDGVARRYFKAV